MLREYFTLTPAGPQVRLWARGKEESHVRQEESNQVRGGLQERNILGEKRPERGTQKQDPVTRLCGPRPRTDRFPGAQGKG